MTMGPTQSRFLLRSMITRNHGRIKFLEKKGTLSTPRKKAIAHIRLEIEGLEYAIQCLQREDKQMACDIELKAAIIHAGDSP